MAESAIGQDEKNHVFWSADRAGKKGPSCARSGFPALVTQEKFFFWPNAW